MARLTSIGFTKDAKPHFRVQHALKPVGEFRDGCEWVTLCSGQPATRDHVGRAERVGCLRCRNQFIAEEGGL